MQYSFKERLFFSHVIVGEMAEETIMRMIPGCVSVEKTEMAQDLKGIDYFAKLRGGAIIGIDHKARDRGCSEYWGTGPEIALEIWSVIGENGLKAKTGWTLDESKETDYTLHTFHPDDSNLIYLFPFQLLRKAFRNNYTRWKTNYKVAIQDSGFWRSQCVFVPVSVLEKAITDSQLLNG